MRIFLILLILLCSLPSISQTLIGFSADLGNRVGYESTYPTQWLYSPLSVSGTLYFLKQEEMRNNYYLQYGAGLGVHGHKIKINDGIDTIGMYQPDWIDVIPNYHTVFTSFELGLGKVLTLPARDINLAIILSSGLTHYFKSEFSTDSYETETFNGPSYLVFQTQTINDGSNLNGFVDFGVNLILYDRMNVGLHYRYHFTEAFRGTYKIYHTRELSEGDVIVHHRVLTLKLLYDLSL